MKVKLKTATKILIIICFIGLSLLLYPTVSNHWNQKHATQAITAYVNELEDFDGERYQRIWGEAVQYNEDLRERENPFVLDADMHERYLSCLDVSGTGVMGYVEIPKLEVSLPIYHGTSEGVLQKAIGHLDWSSLPVGGEGTHCVISGHRGLPSAKLFTDLDKLREGDTFSLIILNEELTYEVDQIRTVEPNGVASLVVSEGMDYCTLVTCTPYGINTHRLLVRGHRIESARAHTVHVISEAIVIDPLIIAPIVAFPFLFLLFMMVMLKKPEKQNKDTTPFSSGGKN